jgi:hypothetical protein
MLICSCRHVPTSTTTAWKRFAIAAAAASPMQHVDSRRRYDTWAEAWAHNMVVYASNSVVSQCFVGTYQGLLKIYRYYMILNTVRKVMPKSNCLNK